jgi:hypothetical protein
MMLRDPDSTVSGHAGGGHGRRRAALRVKKGIPAQVHGSMDSAPQPEQEPIPHGRSLHVRTL